MKTYIHKITMYTAAVAVMITVACGGDSALEKKKAELEELKGAQKEVAEKIKTLEAEIAKLDTTLIVTEKEKTVAVTAVAAQNFVHSIDVQGQVDGDENIAITAKSAGVVKRVNVRVGQTVQKDQILAEIENDIVRTQITDLKSSLALATDMFNKQKSLWDQKIGTEVQYLQAKNTKESLEAKLATLNETLDMYLIKSPISGTVDNLPVKLGQMVAPGILCAQVVNFGSLKIRAELSESYSANVKEGNEVELFFPDINRTIKSKVSYVAQAINPMTRTFGVEIDLPSEKAFRPNMVAVIRIVDYNNSKAIVVPVNTIQSMDGHDHLYIATRKGNRMVATKRDVKVGPVYNGKAEITEGLLEGDQLITSGYQDLNDNELIRY